MLFRQAQAPPRIDPSEPPPDVADSPERVAATNLAFASLDTVTLRAKERLGSPLSVKELRDQVKFEPAGQADIVRVIASGATPDVAARRANVFAEEVVGLRSDRARDQVQRVIDTIRARLTSAPAQGRVANELNRRIEQLEVEKGLEGGDAEIAEEAAAPLDPVAPKPIRNTAIGGLLGLILGALLAVVLRRFDRRVENETELSELIGAPVLGRIPVEGEGWEQELYHESFHFLRTNLEVSKGGHRHQVIAVTGAVPGVGKSSVVARLSEALALGGSRVVAVDCDLRKPKLHDYFGVSGEFGVADALSAGRGAPNLLYQTAEGLLQETENGVRVLAAGTYYPVANSVMKGAAPLSELVDPDATRHRLGGARHRAGHDRCPHLDRGGHHGRRAARGGSERRGPGHPGRRRGPTEILGREHHRRDPEPRPSAASRRGLPRVLRGHRREPGRERERRGRGQAALALALVTRRARPTPDWPRTRTARRAPRPSPRAARPGPP